MRVVDASNPKSQPWDMPSAFAAVLIKAGMIQEWHPPVETREANTRWGVFTFNSGKPYLAANCSSCKPASMQVAQFVYEGDNPDRMQIRHCGVTEFCPADVAQSYRQILKKHQPV